MLLLLFVVVSCLQRFCMDKEIQNDTCPGIGMGRDCLTFPKTENKDSKIAGLLTWRSFLVLMRSNPRALAVASGVSVVYKKTSRGGRLSTAQFPQNNYSALVHSRHTTNRSKQTVIKQTHQQTNNTSFKNKTNQPRFGHENMNEPTRIHSW